ncbi:hypothetical protein BDV12DRAFT_197283 [Aspergillus spectabilis]
MNKRQGTIEVVTRTLPLCCIGSSSTETLLSTTFQRRRDSTSSILSQQIAASNSSMSPKNVDKSLDRRPKTGTSTIPPSANEQRKEEDLNSSNLAEVVATMRLEKPKSFEKSRKHRPNQKLSAIPVTPRRLRNENTHWSTRTLTKRVSFARNTLLVPEGPGTPSPPGSPKSSSTSSTTSPMSSAVTSPTTSVPVNSTKAEAPTPKTLDMALLSTIKAFRTYTGCLFNDEPNNKPAILFEVEYLDGATEIIQCGGLIHGEPKSMYEAFGLHMKVRFGKNLISPEDWRYLERRFGFSREKTMEFHWLRQMRERRFETRQSGDENCQKDTRTVFGMLKGATCKVGAYLWKSRPVFGRSG